jgi:hypothetical protein
LIRAALKSGLPRNRQCRYHPDFRTAMNKSKASIVLSGPRDARGDIRCRSTAAAGTTSAPGVATSRRGHGIHLILREGRTAAAAKLICAAPGKRAVLLLRSSVSRLSELFGEGRSLLDLARQNTRVDGLWSTGPGFRSGPRPCGQLVCRSAPDPDRSSRSRSDHRLQPHWRWGRRVPIGAADGNSALS